MDDGNLEEFRGPTRLDASPDGTGGLGFMPGAHREQVFDGHRSEFVVDNRRLRRSHHPPELLPSHSLHIHFVFLSNIMHFAVRARHSTNNEGPKATPPRCPATMFWCVCSLSHPPGVPTARSSRGW